ncbi:MAG: hypothetical protein AAB358_00500 [Patescibacteria group bacterium]
MKKLLIFAVASLAIFLAGCTTQLLTKNQSEPTWIKTLIDTKKNSPLENPPSTIRKCTYQNKIVYYVSSPCCDQYNYLYDDNNKVICAPDGGFTGNGNGKCSDFSLDKNNCELIWQDSRSK